MVAKARLICRAMCQDIDLMLNETYPALFSVDFSDCASVFEDGAYEIEFSCEEHSRDDVLSVSFNVNGESIGAVRLQKEGTTGIRGNVEYEKVLAQPFLLQYDLVIISFTILFRDRSIKEYFSSFLMCVSKSPEDSENIQKIIQEVLAFNDTQIGEWLFSGRTKQERSSLLEGKWSHRAYKSLSSYVQLLEEIATCYKNNFAYFKAKGKHSIGREEILVSYDEVKNVTVESFHWLMQNEEQLSPVLNSSGIYYNGKNYLPNRMKTTQNKKSWNVYENRTILHFLYSVLINARTVYKEFFQNVLDEEKIIQQIHGRIPVGYQAPIITIKKMQVSFCKILMGKLYSIIGLLQSLYKQYQTLFDIPVGILISLPKKTKTFQEISTYAQVFKIILKWFQYGEFSLEKEQLLLQVKTLDKLFEYFCLLKLLGVLASHGYQIETATEPSFKFEYSTSDGRYQNEKDVANTYLLRKENTKVTLYYQPVVSSFQFENGLSIFRTTVTHRGDYYTPDFVLKITRVGEKEVYAIFDSKFSPRKVIREYGLPEIIRKYSCEIATQEGTPPKMIWALQGRVDSREKPIWKYHNAPLASRYIPQTSYGIISVNTMQGENDFLWDELKRNIPWLA